MVVSDESDSEFMLEDGSSALDDSPEWLAVSEGKDAVTEDTASPHPDKRNAHKTTKRHSFILLLFKVIAS